MDNRFLVKNIEKLIFFILVVILILAIVAYKSGFFLRCPDIEKKLSNVEFVEPPDKIEGLDKYKKAIIDLQKKGEFSQYDKYFQNDGFTRYIELPPPQPLFELRSIKRLPLDIIYNGFIEYTGGVVGQINIGGTTYFVRKGEKIQDYEIIDLTGSYAVVKDSKGKEIKLPLRVRLFSDKYEATIFLNNEDKTIKVRKGDVIKNFRVLDISPNYVVLFNQITKKKEHLTLTSE